VQIYSTPDVEGYTECYNAVMAELVTVKTFSSRPEAEIAKGILVANKIPAIITADDGGGMYAIPITFSAGVEVKVHEKDVKLARELLETFQESS
jgi:hypothetical protein